MVLRRALLHALPLTLIPAAAAAADLYVDASAAGGGDGSQGAPFQEIQDGMAAAMPGDVVHVLPGTYGAVTTVRDGTAADPITFVAEPARMAIVQANGRAARVDHGHLVFDGIVFDSAYGGGTQDGVTANDSPGPLTFRNIEVRHAAKNCIDLRNASDVLIADSELHHCILNDGALGDAHGVTADSSFNVTIRNTEIYLVSGDSVQISPGRVPWDNWVIEGCTLWTGPLDEAGNGIAAGTIIGENALDTKVGGDGNGNGGRPKIFVRDTVAYGWRNFITNQGAFNLKEDMDAVVERVTVSDSEIAFRLRAPANVRVQNAVIYDVDKAFRLEDGLADAQLLNLTLGAGVITAFQDAGGAPTGLVTKNLLFQAAAVPAPADADPSNMATDDAVFVDGAGGDYHLLPASAPVDAGESVALVLDDRDKVARPVGAGFDVGAYEWTDDPPDPTTGGSSGGSDSDSATSGDSSTSGSGSGSGSATATATATATAGTDSGADTDPFTSDSGGQGGGAGCACALSHPGHPGLLGLIWVVLGGALRRRR